MKSKNKNLLIASMTAIVLFVCVTLGVVFNMFAGDARAQGNGDPVLVGGEISEEYLLNDVLSVPAAQITFGGETKNAEISVITPRGERVRSANVKLEEGGQYKVEYKALFGGKAKTVEKPFTVEIPLFSKSAKNTTWEYGVDDSIYQTGKEGVKVLLAKGDSLVYNDILDLRESNGQIIDLFTLPQDGLGTRDVRRIVLTLTDLYDPSVYLTIALQGDTDTHNGSEAWWLDWTYVAVGGQNQILTGVDGKGTSKETVWRGASYGVPVAYASYGIDSKGNNLVASQSLNVSYNESENAVYVGSKQIMCLSDLKYYDDVWTGFTNGEVKLTITGDDFALGTADLMITKIGNNNLKGELYKDETAPEITLDLLGYESESDLPQAAKGLSYPVFSAKAWDKVFGEVDVKTTVYYGYGSQQRYEVDVKDGKFATDVIGYYTIEYLAYDGFKNEGKKTVKIYCGNTSADLSVEAVGEYETSKGTGAITRPAQIKYTGGTGFVTTYATAKAENGGEEFVIDGSFRPEMEGVYKITLYAVDMLGKTKTFTYDLTVSITNEPVFIDEPILPKFFLQGYNYTLPTMFAYDYSSGKESKQIETTIAIKDGKDGGAVRDLASNVADFVADENGEATIIYKASGEKGNGSAQYKVKVVNAWKDISRYTLDMAKYFYGENIETSATDEGVKVSSTQDATYTFVTPVIADKFETKFAITSGNFTCLQLVFEDAYNSNERFTVEIDKSENGAENALLRVNGVQTKYRPWGSFYNKTDFLFAYDEMNKMIKADGSYPLYITNADGSAFEGFSSGLIYVTVNVIGVNGEAQVIWKNYAGQVLSNKEFDTIAPSIKLSADYDSKYSIGTVAEIYSAVAADVLSPEVSTKMTVRDPKGNIITDVDGLLLKDVPFDRSYFINLELYGSYIVKYSAMDWMEREQDYSFSILVVDDQAPEISLEGTMKTEINVNQKFEIIKASAKDNVDGDVNVYVYLVNPSGVISKVTAGEQITFAKKGVYQVRYFSIDAFGNLNILYYNVTVV